MNTTLFNEEGYMHDLQHWNQTIAMEIAKNEDLTLSDDHWAFINYLRQYYITYHLFPGMRTIVLAMKTKLGKDKGNSAYLNALFPGGIFRQGCKIAGLPKPEKCL